MMEQMISNIHKNRIFDYELKNDFVGYRTIDFYGL